MEDGIFMTMLSILRPNGTFYGHLVHFVVHFVVFWYIFPPFWYVVPSKIWQPWSQKAKRVFAQPTCPT
jgi:uncharacterized membrane protein